MDDLHDQDGQHSWRGIPGWTTLPAWITWMSDIPAWIIRIDHLHCLGSWMDILHWLDDLDR
eukprot:9497179-Karenia_brevis.AAC.1